MARCEEAISQLASLPLTSLRRRSAWYETEPVIDRPLPSDEVPDWFLNGVVELETHLSPTDLVHQCLEIERRMGRIRSHKVLAQSGGDAILPLKPPSPYERKPSFSRPIDLDLLLYGDEVLTTPELTIPHPRLHLRRFVLVPLAELAPNLIHPTLHQSIAALLDQSTDPHRVVKLAPAPPGTANNHG